MSVLFSPITCVYPTSKRKAQVFTIRHTGLQQPLTLMGSLRLGTSSSVLDLPVHFRRLQFVWRMSK